MPSYRNAQGLRRDIPAEVARQVRQRCGFGCVICGRALFHYDHLGTEFAVAAEHNPDEITLLCAGHHDEKTRGWLSTQQVSEANDDPYCKKKGHATGPFYLGQSHPEIVLGAITCIRADTIIEIERDRVLFIAPPEVPDGPFRINALMTDDRGNAILHIVDNEWVARAENWDVEVSGPTISIRRGPRKIALVMRHEAQRRLVFERIHMSHRGITFDCQEGKSNTFTLQNGQSFEISQGATMDCETCIRFETGGATVGVGVRAAAIPSFRIP